VNHGKDGIEHSKERDHLLLSVSNERDTWTRMDHAFVETWKFDKKIGGRLQFHALLTGSRLFQFTHFSSQIFVWINTFPVNLHVFPPKKYIQKVRIR
jgi:hypothetical protein